MNIPNFITLVRLIMIPVFLILLTRKPPYMTSALIVFIFSALTDALDGIIARNTGKITGLGKFLDPMADKLLLVSAFTALTILGLVPLWITIIVFARDVFLFIGWLGLFVIGRDVDIKPSIYSKITTFMQMTTVVLVLIKFSNIKYIYYLTAGFTVLSGIHYMLITLMDLSQEVVKSE